MKIVCSDCEEEKDRGEVSSRADLCGGCWNARKALLEQRKAGLISHEEFVYAQKGESRRARIESVLKK